MALCPNSRRAPEGRPWLCPIALSLLVFIICIKSKSKIMIFTYLYISFPRFDFLQLQVRNQVSVIFFRLQLMGMSSCCIRLSSMPHFIHPFHPFSMVATLLVFDVRSHPAITARYVSAVLWECWLSACRYNQNVDGSRVPPFVWNSQAREADREMRGEMWRTMCCFWQPVASCRLFLSVLLVDKVFKGGEDLVREPPQSVADFLHSRSGLIKCLIVPYRALSCLRSFVMSTLTDINAICAT